MRTYGNFEYAIASVSNQMRDSSYEVRGTRWQSIDVSMKPEMRMMEVLNVSFHVNTKGIEEPTYYHNDIRPNYPWAEDHFQERVCGQPLNPGEQWKNWPWALSADKFRTEGQKFSHTYMERYWPKLAGDDEHSTTGVLRGIRYKYGDLDDVVNHLLADPLSRQAFLPIWFPEDTGVVHGERVPCSLGYHWILRNGYLHTTYYIRSCDFFRHFRDDLYLSIRLSIWLLERLREKENQAIVTKGEDGPDQIWHEVKLGLFTFHCVSMHCFVNDWNKLYGPK